MRRYITYNEWRLLLLAIVLLIVAVFMLIPSVARSEQWGFYKGRQVVTVDESGTTRIEVVIDSKESATHMVFGPNTSDAKLGRDLRECYENGHIDFVKSQLAVTYRSDDVDPDSGQNIIEA